MLFSVSNIKLLFSLPYALIMGIAITFLMDWLQLKNIINSSSNTKKEQEIEISEQGLFVKRENGNAFVNRDGILKISNDYNGVYFFSNPRCAFIVPKRFFTSEYEFMEFIKKANEYKLIYTKRR